MSISQHRFVRLLQILVVLAVLYQLALLLRPDPAFLSRPYIEDAFYSLSAARSIAGGHGFSVDEVHPTNGVQPLICLLEAPFFIAGGFDNSLSLRLLLFLFIALYLGAAWMIAGFTRELFTGKAPPESERAGGDEDPGRLIFWTVFALVSVNYVISIHYLNGLETGLAGGLIFASLWRYARLMKEPESTGLLSWMVLGGLLGLSVLARIDAALLVVALVLWHLLAAHRLYGGLQGPERLRGLIRTLLQLLVMGGTALLISSPWWIYNYTTFGSLMPISGQSQQWLFDSAVESIVQTFNVLSDSLMPGLQTPHGMRIGSRSVAPFGLAALIVLLVVLSRIPVLRAAMGRTRQEFGREWNLGGAGPLILFSLILVVFYTFFFRAPHFQARYLIIPRIAIMLGMVAFGFSLWRRVRGEGKLRSLLAAAALLPMVFFFAFFSRHFEDRYDNFMVYTVLWIDQHVKEGEKVGMYQSGTTGFVYPDIVVNLDGKVNSRALRAYQAGRFPAFVDSADFKYIIDWEGYTDRGFSDPQVREKYRPIDTLDLDMIVWERREPAGSAGENPK